MSDLAASLEQVARGFSGRVGYALSNVTTDERVVYGADALFPTASVAKMPLLTAFHAYVEERRLSWDDAVVIDAQDVPGGSGTLQHLSLPRAVSYRDAAWLMICVSDNLATNILLRTMTIDGTNRLIRRLIGDNIFIDAEARYQPEQPVRSMGRASPRALLSYLEGLVAGRLPGAAQTLETARQQLFRNMIPRYLPHQPYGASPVRIANKTGALPGIRADVAVLETQATVAAMVFMTADGADKGFRYENEGEEIIGRLAQLTYAAWMGG
jgi:beta-lactamase class A